MAAIGVMALGALVARATEEVLWWQVPEDPDVTTFREGVKKASELGGVQARVVTTDGEYLVIPPGFEPPSLSVPMGEAWFAVFPDNPQSLLFMVELGNWVDGSWVVAAQSQSYTYAQLQSHIVQDWSNPYADPAITPWVAEGYVVPEPSSGILLLIGGGLLALRRKRRG